MARDGGFFRNRTPTALILYDPAGAGLWLRDAPYSTVTVLAKLRGWSTSAPRAVAK